MPEIMGVFSGEDRGGTILFQTSNSSNTAAAAEILSHKTLKAMNNTEGRGLLLELIVLP